MVRVSEKRSNVGYNFSVCFARKTKMCKNVVELKQKFCYEFSDAGGEKIGLIWLASLEWSKDILL